ncbi:unnamed protein product [Allacma fusca]|uniref:Uncharacterized protein n=1 Tax=Allacma fusca TaxID=39272 RepID=A0A8J2JSG6_9HEXA|nr:unnamed protein product [Allacma fusca]
MSETIFCCCGVSCWARFIGWFQIVSSIISVVVLTIALTLVPWDITVEFSKVNMAAILGFSLDFEKIDAETQDNFLLTYLVILCVSNLIAILTAFALLKGTYQKKPKYIIPWIVVKIADTILTIGMEVATCVVFIIERDMAVCAMKILCCFFINGFLICFVATHKAELENSNRKVRPTMGNVYKI